MAEQDEQNNSPPSMAAESTGETPAKRRRLAQSIDTRIRDELGAAGYFEAADPVQIVLPSYNPDADWIHLIRCDALTAAHRYKKNHMNVRTGVLNPTDPTGPGHWLRGERSVEASFFMRSMLSATLKKRLYENFHPSAVVYSPRIKLFNIMGPPSVLEGRPEQDIHVDFFSCKPRKRPNFTTTETENGDKAQQYQVKDIESEMYTRVVNILNVAVGLGTNTLILPPFGTELKFNNPADSIASMFRKALLGDALDQHPTDWRRLGLRKVIFAIDTIRADSLANPDQDEWYYFTKHFSGQPGVEVDNNVFYVPIDITTTTST